MKCQKGARRYWVFPGGGVGPGESLLAAARRAALKETTLALGDCEPVFCLVNRGRQGHFFTARVTSQPVSLGFGPERTTSSPVNFYQPCWIIASELDWLFLFPVAGCQLVLALLAERRL